MTGSVSQRENTQSSKSSYISKANLEPKMFVPGMNVSELQRVLSDCLSPAAKTKELQNTKRGVKVPTRFGQFLTRSSVIIEEKEPVSYKQALKSSIADKLLDALKEQIQNLNENQTWSLVKHCMAKKLYLQKWVFTIKRNEQGVAEKYNAGFSATGIAQTDSAD